MYIITISPYRYITADMTLSGIFQRGSSSFPKAGRRKKWKYCSIPKISNASFLTISSYYKKYPELDTIWLSRKKEWQISDICSDFKSADTRVMVIETAVEPFLGEAAVNLLNYISKILESCFEDVDSRIHKNYSIQTKFVFLRYENLIVIKNFELTLLEAFANAFKILFSDSFRIMGECQRSGNLESLLNIFRINY